MNAILKCVLGFGLLNAPLVANAALIPVKSGSIIDDTDNTTMWLSDGNAFHSLAQASGDPASFVQAVIAASDGVVSDFPNPKDTPANSGQYSLVPEDFDAVTGQMTWWGAQAFVTYLNSINYLGYSDWRQPTIVDAPSSHHAIGTAPGYTPPTTGELTQLFYVELGSDGNPYAFLAGLNSNTALFVNLNEGYWYGTECLSTCAPGDGAWFFSNANGASPKGLGTSKRGYFFAFPIRTGQAPLAEMLASINGIAKSTGVREADREEIREANDLLKESCEEMGDYSQRAPAPGNANSTATAIAADVKAVKDMIGCK